MNLLYLANNRLPTEKAHGLQIVQNCEALAEAGFDVTLAAPRRINTPEMRAVGSLWDHYGVARNFAFRCLPCLDLFALFPRGAFLIQTSTYLLAVLLWPAFWRADVIYTRDLFLGVLAALVRPRTRLVYEVHQLHRSGAGRRLEQFVARRARVVAITVALAEALRAQGARHVLVARDGVRAARFTDLPAWDDARAALGWPREAFVVGWIGRLHLMGVDKGVGLLVDALRDIDGAALAIVGGPDDMVEALRARWIGLGLDPARFLAAGQVDPDRVPLYLRAFDVCAMPHPWTEQFAYHTSPMKLFEYMAAERPLVASDLPAFAEVVTNEVSALLVPPGDAAALAEAISQLRDDPALGVRLAARAREEVMQRYTWRARAESIRAFVETT